MMICPHADACTRATLKHPTFFGGDRLFPCAHGIPHEPKDNCTFGCQSANNCECTVYVDALPEELFTI